MKNKYNLFDMRKDYAIKDGIKKCQEPFKTLEPSTPWILTRALNGEHVGTIIFKQPSKET